MIHSNVIPSKAGCDIYGYKINQSLRFNDDDSAYLSRTPTVAGNRKTWTFSTWVKRGNLGSYQRIFDAGSSNDTLMFYNNNTLQFWLNGASTCNIQTTQIFRDTSSWYHIQVAVDTTQVTETDRVKIYVNGKQITSFNTAVYPTQNYNCVYYNNTSLCDIGAYGAGVQPLDGYLAETHFIDGQALTPDYFGEFDTTYGNWKPKKYAGTYGTNGFYLPYKFEPTAVHDILGDGSATATYLLDGNINDLGGTYNGSIISNTTFSAGKFGQSAIVNSGKIDLGPGSKALMPHNSNYSVSVWFYYDGTSKYRILAARHNSSTGSGYGDYLMYEDNNTISFNKIYGNVGGQVQSLVYNPSFSIGWHHIVISFDRLGNKADLYVDSVLVASKNNWHTGTYDNNLNVLIGAFHNGNNSTHQDTTRFFNKAISAEEVDILYNEALYSNFDADASGNGNNFTVHNLNATDIVLDSPTNNFATLNVLNGTAYLQEGNLKRYYHSWAADTSWYSTIGIPKSGKWYAEVYDSYAGQGVFVGITSILQKTAYSGSNYARYYNANGVITVDNVDVGTEDSWFTSSSTYILGIAVNSDTNQISFYKDGLLQGIYSFTDIPEDYFFNVSNGSGGSASHTNVFNFGQDSSFAGNKTPQGHTDANGIGDFYYQPPEGYLALCTANLPCPTVVTRQNFNTYKYIGNGGGQQVGEIQKAIDLYPLSNSLRFNDDDSAYLSRTPAVAGNRKTWTFSTWVKRGNLGTMQGIFEGNSGINNLTALVISSDNRILFQNYYASTNNIVWTTPQVFRDSSSWYNIVVSFDSTQITGNTCVKMYVNGTQVELTYQVVQGAYYQNMDSFVNSTNTHLLGVYDFLSTNVKLDGYLAETHLIDGQVLEPTEFGQFDGNGYWVPKAYTGTYGTNGFHLDFNDVTNIGDDSSGNTNDFIVNNLNANDIVLDSPTNNFCVLDPLKAFNSPTVSEGNLYFKGNASLPSVSVGTVSVNKGKFYFEALNNSSVVTDIGLHLAQSPITYIKSNIKTYISDARKRGDGTIVSYGKTYSTGDIIGVAFDLDIGSIEFYKNGVSQGVAFSNLKGFDWVPFLGDAGSNTTSLVTANFGQDSSFAGNKTRQGYTDANGIGDFYYEPPAGFLALCENNIAEFKADLEQPDLVWIKSTALASNHALFNRISGVGKYLSSNTTAAETADANSLDQFNKNGFHIGNSAVVNTIDKKYIAWVWKAGGTPVVNNDGTIQSLVSANVDAGFSIVKYQGNAIATSTVGHGLLKAPEILIIKGLDNSTYSWIVGGSLISAGKLMFLNSTVGETSSTGSVGSNKVTASTFELDSNPTININRQEYITYCFHSVEGYSKIGKYTGNGNADGTFVYCGFRPKYVMIKRTDSTGNWIIKDTERGTYNVIDTRIWPNQVNTEDVNVAYYFDIVSNGFKFRASSSDENSSGGAYLFIAFAEVPFKYANAR